MLQKTTEMISTLSLDVVAGACISSLFVAEMAGVQLHWSLLLALCICVWLIYTADHLYDALHIAHPAHSSRHRFHQQHGKVILNALILTGATGLGLLFFLPLPLLYWGAGGVALVGCYFLIIRTSKQIHKELIIAFLYPAGIFLPSLYQLEEIPGMIWLLYLQFVLLALINLLLISLYEEEIDLKDGHHSFVLSYGAEKTSRLVQGTLLLFYLSLTANFLFYEDFQTVIHLSLLLLIMGLALQVLIYKPAPLRRRERYRKLADSIFLFPLIHLVLT